jgi:hypothetical protein
MSKRIRDTSKTEPLIRDTSKTERPLDPAKLAAALGAEPTGITIEGGGPMTHLAVAIELGKRRPRGARPTIPLADEQRKQLDDLAADLASNGFTPSAGQVAAALLTLSLRALADPSADRGPLARALAEIARPSPNDDPSDGTAPADEGSTPTKP